MKISKTESSSCVLSVSTYFDKLTYRIYWSVYEWLRRTINRLSMTCVRRSGSPGLAHFFLTSTRWLPMYENQNPVTNSREKCYQIYLWPFQTSKMNFLPNDPFFYWSVPKVAYWWVEQHITRSVSVPQPLQSYCMMKFHIASKLSSYMRILLRKFLFRSKILIKEKSLLSKWNFIMR